MRIVVECSRSCEKNVIYLSPLIKMCFPQEIQTLIVVLWKSIAIITRLNDYILFLSLFTSDLFPGKNENQCEYNTNSWKMTYIYQFLLP